ncbi:hypothetical protein [Bergeyella cardium]|nr:hypothetical protein [Bergeyella cardium]
MKQNFQNLNYDYTELSKEFEQMKKKYEDERKKNQELEEENKKIKLQASISGNPEHNRLMKNHLNRLIKEVDFCIAELQNSGL